MYKMRLNEIVIFGYHYPVLSISKFDDFCIGRSIAHGQIQRVESIVASQRKPVTKTPWQLRIDQKFHACKYSKRCTCVMRAAKSRQAKISACSKSG